MSDDTDFRTRFSGLARALPTEANTLLQQGRAVHLRPGDVVFDEGIAVEAVPLVLEGRVRVFKLSATGNEITLYEIHPGETCVLAASAAISGHSYSAIAVADTPLTAWLIPSQTFRELFARFAPFRTFFFNLLESRLAVMMSLVEEIAFRRVDTRLASHLAERADDVGEIRETHEQIAIHLGTAREVVSRLLADFARRGLIRTGRARIIVTDRPALIAVSERRHTSS